MQVSDAVNIKLIWSILIFCTHALFHNLCRESFQKQVHFIRIKEKRHDDSAEYIMSHKCFFSAFTVYSSHVTYVNIMSLNSQIRKMRIVSLLMLYFKIHKHRNTVHTHIHTSTHYTLASICANTFVDYFNMLAVVMDQTRINLKDRTSF